MTANRLSDASREMVCAYSVLMNSIPPITVVTCAHPKAPASPFSPSRRAPFHVRRHARTFQGLLVENGVRRRVKPVDDHADDVALQRRRLERHIAEERREHLEVDHPQPARRLTLKRPPWTVSANGINGRHAGHATHRALSM